MNEAYKYIDAYMKWMYNRWNQTRCIAIFGTGLGEYIWSKWVHWCEYGGTEAAISQLWFGLDRGCIEQILDTIAEDYKL